MHKKSSDELLGEMISQLLIYLEELSSGEPKPDPFIYGEKTAYVECLEWLQAWEYADRFGLNFNIEQKFSL